VTRRVTVAVWWKCDMRRLLMELRQWAYGVRQTVARWLRELLMKTPSRNRQTMVKQVRASSIAAISSEVS